MKFKTFFMLLTLFYAPILSLPISSEGIEYLNNENYNKIAKIDLDSNIEFLEKNESEDKKTYFKGLIKTDKYRMNPNDGLSYSNTYEILQKKYYFNLDIDMKKETMYGYVRIFYQCVKKSKYFILDFKSLEIFKIVNENKHELNYWFIKNTKVSKALGLGLKIELNSTCEESKNNYFVDVFYSTTKKSTALHFSHRIMVENKSYGFMYSHSAAIFARTLFPCQDTPFAKISLEAKLRIDEPYTILFTGILKRKIEIKKNVKNDSYESDCIINSIRSLNITDAFIKNQTKYTIKKRRNYIKKLGNTQKRINHHLIKNLKIIRRKSIKMLNDRIQPKKSNNLSEFYFINDKPISTYLVTFSAGNLLKRAFGDKCIVYGEPKIISSQKTNSTFFDCSKFVDFFDKNIHKNEWGTMIFLIVPDDFPYAGMENPYNIHISKSVLTDDGSMRNVVAHEIAHFWSGNLVTNRNWEHFWLNEGFTNYLYRKCYQKLFGNEEFMKELDKSQKRLEAFMKKEAYLEKMRKEKKLKEEKKKKSIKKLVDKSNEKSRNDNDEEDLDNFSLQNKDKSHLSLWPKIKRTDPYNNFSLIPYEKGFSLLYYLETKFGEKFVFGLLRLYFSKFKFSSATTPEFLNLVKSQLGEIKGNNNKKLLKEINLNEWIYGTKNIPQTFKIKSTLLEKIKNFVKNIVSFKIPNEKIFLKILKFNSYYRNYILWMVGRAWDKIPEKDEAKYKKLVFNLIDKFFSLEKINLLESSTKSKLITLKSLLIDDTKERKMFLIKNLFEFKFYHISYLKKIFSDLKFECNMKSHEILKLFKKIKPRLNKLAVLRLKQFLYKK